MLRTSNATSGTITYTRYYEIRWVADQWGLVISSDLTCHVYIREWRPPSIAYIWGAPELPCACLACGLHDAWSSMYVGKKEQVKSGRWTLWFPSQKETGATQSHHQQGWFHMWQTDWKVEKITSQPLWARSEYFLYFQDFKRCNILDIFGLFWNFQLRKGPKFSPGWDHQRAHLRRSGCAARRQGHPGAPGGTRGHPGTGHGERWDHGRICGNWLGSDPQYIISHDFTCILYTVHITIYIYICMYIYIYT